MIFLYRVFLLLLVLTSVISTSIDIFTPNNRFRSKKIISSFSLTANFKSLIKINDSPNLIRCIDGLKVLAALYIVLGHRMEFTYSTKYFFNPWLQNIKQFILGYKFGLDVFFVCSAVLITMSLLRTFQA